MPNSSWIGVAIACGGNVLISLGLNSQKLAHQRLESQVQSIRNAPLEAIKVNSSDQLDSATSSIRRRTSRQHSNPASPLWSPNGLAPLPVIRSLDAEHGDQIIGTTSTQQDARHGRHEATLAEEFEEQSGGWNVHAENGLSVSPIQEVTEEEEADQGEMGNGEGEREGYLKSPLWWGGLALCAVGEAGNFLSYGFAPASVVAPLGTVALVANCFLSPIMLGEHLKWRDLLGVLLAIVGAVTVVISAKDSNPSFDPHSLLEAICSPAFVAYTIVNAVLIIILLLLTHSKRFGNRWIGVDIGICALFGGYTVLSTKALSSLLSRMFIKIFRYPITWVLLLVLVTTSVLQIRYLNRALMQFEGKQVIPTQFVFFSVSAIVGSAVLYQEFRDITFSQMLNFLFGVATTFLGVFLLTATSNGDNEADEDMQGQPDDRQEASRVHLVALPENAPLLPTVSRSSVNQGYLAASAKPIRLRKRSSTTSLAGARPGLASGGFLLMATTPPAAHPNSTLSKSLGSRSRSASRSGPTRQDIEPEEYLAVTTLATTMNSMPTFPDLQPSTTFSFTSAYAYQTAAPPQTTARLSRSNSTNRRRPPRRDSDQNNAHQPPIAPGPSRYRPRHEVRSERQGDTQEIRTARIRRVLLGQRPAGTQLTRESEELSDQEEAVYHAEIGIRNFGHGFLLPPGRRQTQTEHDYPPSPTPSDAPDQEHRQEDQGGESPGIVEEEGPVEDLDNEIEDRDNTREEEQDDTMGD